MKVTVIGAGNMGAAFVKQLTRAGHQVTVTARNLERAQAVAAANPGAVAVAVAGAAASADAVVLATGYSDAVTALQSLGDLNGQTVTVFVASDSERARQTATALAQSMGFATMDAGGLKNARYLEPVAGFNIYLGYGAGLGTSIAPTWIKRA